MMNRYPIWGYLALTAVILIGALYAIPNLYPEDPSVQISHDSGGLPADLKQRVESILSLNDVKPSRLRSISNNFYCALIILSRNFRRLMN